MKKQILAISLMLIGLLLIGKPTIIEGQSSSPNKTEIVVASVESSAEEKAYADYVADGIDDQIDIQLALEEANSSPSGSGVVLLLDGWFTVSAPVFWTDATPAYGLVLKGQGLDLTRIRQSANATGSIIEYRGTKALYWTTIKDIFFRGNLGANPNATEARSAIHFEPTGGGTVSQLRLEHIYVEYFTGDGIYIRGTQNNYLSDVSSEGNKGNGLSLSHGATQIFGGLFTNNQAAGIKLAAATNFTITGATIQNNQIGIHAISSSEGTVFGNHFRGNLYSVFLQGISYSPTRDISFVSNQFYNSGSAAVYGQPYTSYIVLGLNTFENNLSNITGESDFSTWKIVDNIEH